jgi:hypothetical protein
MGHGGGKPPHSMRGRACGDVVGALVAKAAACRRTLKGGLLAQYEWVWAALRSQEWPTRGLGKCLVLR